MIRNIAAVGLILLLGACQTLKAPDQAGPVTFNQSDLDTIATVLKDVCVDNMGDALAMAKAVNDMGGYDVKRERVKLNGKFVSVKHYRIDNNGRYLTAVSFYGDGGACSASYASNLIPSDLLYREIGAVMFDGEYKHTKAGYIVEPRLGVGHITSIRGDSVFDMLMVMDQPMYASHQNATGAPDVEWGG